VVQESFPVVLHRQIRTELNALSDEPYRINCAAQIFAANTPPDGIEGELVFVETAHPQYLEDHFRDKVSMRSSTPPNSYATGSA